MRYAPIALLLAACSQGTVPAVPAPPGPITMTPSAWTVLYSAGVPDHPTAAGTGWYLDLPNCNGDVPTCSLNMVVDGGARAISGKLVANITITTTGTPTVNHVLGDVTNTCTPLTGGNTRFIVANGDLGFSDKRWFSHSTVDLKPGTFTLTAPITGSDWGGVYGHAGNSSAADTTNFNSTMAASTAVGLVFGGGCFAGHGVNVMGGTMRITVTDFRVTP